MSAPSRAPAGTPEGGRFAPGRRAESGVTLDTASEESGQIDPVILDEMAHRRVAIAQAEQEYGRVCARGLADIVSRRWPQAHALEMEPWFENPDHLVVTGVYASGDGGRLPVTDAELYDFNFDNDNVFEMTSALQTAPKGQGSEYMSSDSKLLGQTFDVDKALSLRVTDDEIAQEHIDRADATISDAVFAQFPDATSWSVSTRKYEDDYSYSPHIRVANLDGSIDYLDGTLPSVTPETLDAVRGAVDELNDLDGQLSADSTHDHDISRRG